MAQVINLKARGLITHPNRLDLPNGALTRGVNATIDKENVVDTSRGSKKYGEELDTAASKLFSFADRLLLHQGSTLEYDSDGAGDWTAYSGTYDPPTGMKIQSFRANNNFYFTTDEGIKKIDSLTGTPANAGMPKALDGQATLSSAGSGFFTADAQLAYRIVWGIEDANENLILGAPSERILVVNPSGGTADTVDLEFTIPDGITTSHFFQIYRSALSATDATVANDELQLVIDRNPDATDISNGYVTVTDVTPEDLRGAALYTNQSQETIAKANDLPPLAKDATVFKDHALYVNTETRQRFFATLITAGSPNWHYYTPTGDVSSGSDQITNISDTTGLSVGQKVEGTDIPADTTITALDTGASSATMSANATGNQTGITITFRDGVTIDGTSYWAASAYNETNMEFQSYNSGTPADDIEDTAKSICKLINRSAANIYAYYISGYDELPGKMLFEDRSIGGSSWAITASSGESWDPVLPATGTDKSSSNERKKNRCYIAKPKEPEAVPILQYVDVGSEDDEIVRVVALRDSVFFLKYDGGIYRMTGTDVSNFDVDEFDKSVSIRGPETAAVLNNQGWCHSNQGVISFADNGVQVWSRAIEEDLLQIGALSNLEDVAFAVSYETERKYELWLPSASDDTYATQARIYNTFTGTWMEDNHSRTCGLVNPEDNKKYMGQGDEDYIRQERKTYTAADYAEDDYSVTVVGSTGTTIELSDTSDCEEGQTIAQGLNRTAIIQSVTDSTHIVVDKTTSWEAGAATVYDPIYVYVQWAPIHGGNPGLVKQFPELDLFFRDARFTELELFFQSNFAETSAEVPVEPIYTGAFGDGPYGSSPWGGGPPADQPIRTLTPLEQQRAHWLIVSVEHEEALSNIGMEGISLMMKEMSTRFVGGQAS